nr:MAG TPA: hypothetical protein [Caudoviricetes sp.]
MKMIYYFFMLILVYLYIVSASCLKAASIYWLPSSRSFLALVVGYKRYCLYLTYILFK